MGGGRWVRLCSSLVIYCLLLCTIRQFLLNASFLCIQPVDGAFTSAFSVYTGIVATPLFDIDFGLFNANQTLNHSFIHQNNNVGPTGDYGNYLF